MDDAVQLSRRSFLRGALSVAAVCVVPLPAIATAPVLYGDGAHDDTAALNALFQGLPVECEGSLIEYRKGEVVRLVGGVYRVTSPVELTLRDVSCVGTRIFADESFQGEYLMHFKNGGNFGFRDIHFDMSRAPQFRRNLSFPASSQTIEI